MSVQIKNAKLKTVGNSYCVIVPMDYIKNEIINLDDEYNVTITLAKKEGVDLSQDKIKDLTNEAVMDQTKKTNI